MLFASLSEELARKLADLENQAAVLGLRPEHLRLAPEAEVHSDPCVAAMVELVEIFGAQTHLHLRQGKCRFVMRLPGDTTVAPEQKVFVTFNWKDARFFDAVTAVALG